MSRKTPKQRYQELGGGAPNVGSWTRRLAHVLEADADRGSWARRAALAAGDGSGVGSWRTRLIKALSNPSEPVVIPASSAYFQTDASVGPSFPDEQPAYFQTDTSVGPLFPDEQAGYFQTDQNVEE